MHSAWLVYELREQILENLNPTRKSDSQALLSMTTTCTVLSDASLDLLWKSQDGLYNLTRTMPRNLWTLVPVKDGLPKPSGAVKASLKKPPPTQILKFRRRLTDSDWDRFDYYALKIHNLILGETKFEPESFRQLCKYRENKKLFPSVTSLEVVLSRSIAKCLDCLPAFLGAQITTLKISIPWYHCPDKSGVLLGLPVVSSGCPSLRTLSVVSKAPYPSIGLAIDEFLAARDGLEELVYSVVWSPSPSVLRCLNANSNLRVLKYPVCDTRTRYTLMTSLSRGFSSLNTLGLRVRDWKATAEVLGKLRQPLQALYLETPSHLHYDRLPPLQATVSFEIAQALFLSITRFSASLTHLTIHELFLLESVSPEDAHTLSSMLLDLRNLQSLHLNEALAVVILDDDWLDFASRAFPDLRELIMRPPHPPLYGETSRTQIRKWPTISLHGLLPLVTNCRSLHHLSLSVACTPLGEEVLVGMKANWIATVRIFNIRCEVEERDRITSDLKLVFPHAKTLITTWAVE